MSVLVEKPAVPLQTQLIKAWIFSQNPDGTFSPATFGGGGGTSDVNLTGINGSAPALANPLAVELSDGTNPFGTSGNPLNVTLHAETTKVIGTVNQGTSPWVVSNGGTFAVQASQNGNWTDRIVGNIGGVLDGVLGAGKPANAVQVGGNDGTNIFALPLASGGGSLVTSGTSTVTQGTAAALTAGWPVVTGQAAEATAAWTSATAQNTAVTQTVQGLNTVVVTLQQTTTITGGVVTFEVSDTTAFTNAYTILAIPINSFSATPTTTYTLVASTNQAFVFNVAGWAAFRVRLSTAISGTATVNVGVTASAAATTPLALVEGSGVNYTANGGIGGANIIGSVQMSDGVRSTFCASASGGGVGIIPVMGMVTTGTPGSTNNALVRTPVVWRGNSFAGPGAGTIWTPRTGLKVRLMKYRVQVSEDATITSGPLPINIAFTEQIGSASASQIAFPGLGFTHRVVVPASVLATSGELYDSDLADMGNGQLLTSASVALLAGIMVPQSTSAVNPTWTIASNQWEAATVGFKTASNAGVFKLVQQMNGVAAAASVALTSISVTAGNSLFVFFRTTNPAGGAPTVTVTDTAANTWTTTALTTNASDGTHGSSLGMAYATNIKGNAANVITVTTTVNVSTEIEAIAIEYNNAAGGIDAALVGTTGSSTSPASGNYTPSTVGDLIFSFFGTAASIATQPTVGSNFLIRGSLFNSTQGCLHVADNFGNGTLATGVVNIQAFGTEE